MPLDLTTKQFISEGKERKFVLMLQLVRVTYNYVPVDVKQFYQFAYRPKDLNLGLDDHLKFQQ